jgi:phosphoglycolate phosphatase
MHRLVIWDFDGPIFNSREARDAALARVDTQFTPQIGACSSNYSEFPLYGPRQTICLAYADKNLAADVLDQIERFYREQLHQSEAKVKIDRDVIDTIRKLSDLDCRLAILSRRSESGLTRLLQSNGLTRYFGIVQARDTPPAAKPSPDAVLAIIRKADAGKFETILVGDSDDDLMAARAAGIAYYHAGWSGEPVAKARVQANQILLHPSEVELIAGQGFASLPSDAQDRKTLQEIVRSGKFSFFAGAGVSIPSGLGDWKGSYVPQLIKHIPESSFAQFPLPEIVQLIVADDSSARRLFDDFKAAFTSHREPNLYHYAIMRSACDTVWTTNYDNLFERVALSSSGQPVPVLRDDAQLKDNFGSGRKLIKVNGDFYAATFKPQLDWGIVISEEQFDLSEVQRPELWRYFEDEYRTSSLIFVGVSFNDPTLRRILSIISRKVMRTRKPHFVLAKKPSTPDERLIVSKQIEVLRQRNIHTVLFENYDDIAQWVAELCMLSRKPVIAFSGTAYSEDEGKRSEEEVAAETLVGGALSFRDLELICGEMGAMLAAGGFRVVSGNGRRIGEWSVAKAYEMERSSARYYMRKRGASHGSRLATTIFIDETDLNVVRERFIQASHVLVAMGGVSYRHPGSISGSVTEAKKAIEMGRPVILFRQGGGDIDKSYNELMTSLQSLKDPQLSRDVLALNERISKMDREQVLSFVAQEFSNCVRALVRAGMVSPYRSHFDDACIEADKEWRNS